MELIDRKEVNALKNNLAETRQELKELKKENKDLKLENESLKVDNMLQEKEIKRIKKKVENESNS